MQLQRAQRKNVKIKLGLQGSSGSGKTYSALLLAFGLSNDWKQIAIIDTENQSASLYTHLGNFNVLNFTPPFSPERYIEAINLCLQAKIQVIVIDSVSMEWEYILDAHGQLSGNSYTNWAKFTLRHQQFIQAILQADCHIICTIRAKQDYVLNEKNGKQVPEKVGLKPIQREGLDYEFTVVLELDIKHNATASKDRTGLFTGKPEFKITAQTGKNILNWCNEGISNEPQRTLGVSIPSYNLAALIAECENVEELRQLYYSVPQNEQQQYRAYFDKRKEELDPSKPVINQSFSINQQYPNGSTNTHSNPTW